MTSPGPIPFRPRGWNFDTYHAESFETTNPESFLARIGGARFVGPMTRHYHARWDTLTVDSLGIASGSATMPVIQHAKIPPLRIFTFTTGPAAPRRFDGRTLGAGAMYLHRPNEEALCTPTTNDPWPFALVAMPEDDFRAAAAALHPGAVLADNDAHVLACDPAPMARLVRLAADAARLVRDHPEIAEREAAAQALRGVVQSALLDCLATGHAETVRRALHRARALARRLTALGWEQPETLLSIPDVATRLGVPASTLNEACQEILGMSTLQYIRGVRMARVRQMLLRAEVAGVTEAATQLGFWELGRFAVAYQARYEEKPSETLRLASGR